MAAYTFEQWRGIDRDKRKAMPGIALTSSTGLLPPTEGGLYWSGNTRALALFGHAERMLTSDDPSERNEYWRQLRHAAFKATELPIEREQADQRYRQRVELALQAEPDLPGVDSTNAIVDAQLAHYNWLDERNEAGVQGSARLEVARMIEQASRWSPDVERVALELGADASPLEAAEHELRIALEAVADLAGVPSAVGFDDARQIVERTREEMERIASDRRRRLLDDAVASFTPDPEEVTQRAESFVVRASTREEARAAEMLIHWAIRTPELPTPSQVKRWFAGAREDGLGAEPYAPSERAVTAVFVADGGFDPQTLAHVLTDEAVLRGTNDLIVAGSGKLREVLMASGYTVVDGQVDTEFGRRLTASGAGPVAQGTRGMILFLEIEHDAAPTERSLVAQAIVARAQNVAIIATDANFGRLPAELTEEMMIARAEEKRRDAEDLMAMPQSDRDGYRAAAARRERGKNVQEASRQLLKQSLPTAGWTPLVAQAAHLANRSRKLSLAIVEQTNVISGRELRDLAAHARDLDAQFDPDRYWGASVFKPFGGLRSVAVDGSRVYRNADEVSARLAAIPDNVVVMSTDHKLSGPGYEHNITRALRDSLGERPVLYAEVLRSSRRVLTHEEGKHSSWARDGFVRALDVKLYDGPRGDPARMELPWGTQPGEPTAKVLFGQKAPLILFSADATPKLSNDDRAPLWEAGDGRIMRGGEVARLVQEALIERAGAAIIFDDMDKDWHAANLTAVAHRMGKAGTVVSAAGEDLSIAEGHEATRDKAYQIGHWNIEKVDQAKETVMSNDVGSLIMMRLPGDNRALLEKYSALAFAGEMAPTLGELIDGFAPDDWVMLSRSAQDALNNPEVLARILGRVELDVAALKTSEAMLFKNVDADHPYRAKDGSALSMAISSTYSDGRARPEGRVIALVAESVSALEAGRRRSISFEREGMDLANAERVIVAAASAGDAVAIKLAHGEPQRLLELALEHDAPIVLVADGAPKSFKGDLATLADRVMQRPDSTLVMPPKIGPVMELPSLKELSEAEDKARAAKEQLSADWAADGRDSDLAKLDAALNEIDVKFQPRPTFKEQRDPAFQLQALAAVADAGVVVAAGPRAPDLATVAALVAMEKPVAIVAVDRDDASSRLAYAPTELARGAGRLEIQEIARSGGGLVSGGVWSNIANANTEFKRVGGMYQGNAGQFETRSAEDPEAFTTLVAGEHRDFVLKFSGRAPVIDGEEAYARLGAVVESGGTTIEAKDRGGDANLKPGWVQRDEQLAAMSERLAGFVREVKWEQDETGRFQKVERVSPEIEAMAERYEAEENRRTEMMREAMGRGRPSFDEADARADFDRGRRVVQLEPLEEAVGISR